MSQKDKIISQLKEKGIDFNPNADEKDLKKLLSDKSKKEDTTKSDNKSEEVLNQIMSTLNNFDKRLKSMETGGVDNFKNEVKEEDVKKADQTKKDIDPKIVSIVEETLGTDFGIEINSFDDKPGFLFTLIVPQRLSDGTQQQRPVPDEKGEYKKDDKGHTIMENYYPEDRRSRSIGSMQSYDAIKEHCDRVRGYIVSYYQKHQKPLPEFKVK